MTPLERSLIEKAGYANGWENVRAEDALDFLKTKKLIKKS